MIRRIGRGEAGAPRLDIQTSGTMRGVTTLVRGSVG